MINASPVGLQNLLDTNLINDLFAAEGMSVTWYPARRCSCWGEIDQVPEASGSPDPACPTCIGTGTSYPTGYVVTGVVLDDMQNVAQWNADSGINYTGTIRMYVPAVLGGQDVPLYTQGTLNDLILAQDILLTTRNVVQRGVDTLRERPVTPVSITQGSTVYVLGQDYRVAGKTVTWLSAGPASGTQYEASYSFQPWFNIVSGMAIARNFAHLNLPRTFTLQLNPDMGETYRGSVNG